MTWTRCRASRPGARATSTTSTPLAAAAVGGLGVVNAEGLWTVSDERSSAYGRMGKEAADGAPPVALLQEDYCEAFKPDLITARIKEMRDAYVSSGVAISPQH